jgi:TatD DNase family protein
MIFCDSHCHLDFDAFNADRDQVIARALENGVKVIINSAIDLKSAIRGIELAGAYPGAIYTAIGFHPNDSSGYSPKSLETLRELSKQPGVVAIGEIGLDYYHQDTPKALQREIFVAQLTLASALDLPVIIHNREASTDILPILQDWVGGLDEDLRIKTRPGVLHSFLEDLDLAQLMADIGFVFGIGGPVTYTNGQERRRVVSGLPLDRIILETDAPFLTPQAHRGRRNEPSYIPLIAQHVAECLGVTIEQVALTTTQNVKSLFRI